MRAVLDRLSELRSDQRAANRPTWGDTGAHSASVFERLSEIHSQCKRSASRSAVAVSASMLAHAAVLVVLAQWTFPEYGHRLISELQAWIEPPAEPEPVELPSTMFEMAQPSDEPSNSVFNSAANAIAPVAGDDSQVGATLNLTPADLETTEVAPIEIQEISALDISQQIVQTGTIGDEVLDVQGAVDRITHEIVTNLADHEVLVIWLMDASISLLEERQQVAERLERVYSQIDQLGGFPPGRDCVRVSVPRS